MTAAEFQRVIDLAANRAAQLVAIAIDEKRGHEVRTAAAVKALSIATGIACLRVDGPAYAASVDGAAAAEPELPDLALLAKFEAGFGGRRTSDLMRRGWLRAEVTPAGRAALVEARAAPRGERFAGPLGPR